jgi:hypothetical protein
LCIHDARNFDEYTQVLAGDTTNKMTFLGGEEGAALCIALLCTSVLRRRLSSKKRYKKLESKNLNGLGWNRNASYFFSTWMENDQSENRILISINL